MTVAAGVLAMAATGAFLAAFAARVDPAVARLVGTVRVGEAGRPRRIPGTLARSRLVLWLARGVVLERRLRAARWSRSLEDVIAWKVLGAAGVAIAVPLLAPGLLPLSLPAAAGAFVVPDILVTRAATRRMRAADAELAQFLDLLAACSAAGLAVPAAIRRAATGLRGPLKEDLDQAAAAVEVGGRWHDELERVAERLRLPDLHAAVTAIKRTESLGSSLSATLRDLSADVRESRRARATERARTAPVKMLFPLVFMILPAFLLLTVVPVLIATLRSLK